ncbi:hypothetical protein U1Q18_040757 [Sarracenia purpurea var. burkii]
MDDPQVSAMGKEEFMESLDARPRAPLRMQAKAQSLTKLSREEDLVDNPVQEQLSFADLNQVIQVENSDEDEGFPDMPPVSSPMRSLRCPPDKKSSSSGALHGDMGVLASSVSGAVCCWSPF